MTGKIRKFAASMALLFGASFVTSAHARPIIDVQIVPPELQVAIAPIAPPPPVKVVHVVPGRVWVPAYYQIDRRGRRVLVPGHYTTRRVTTKRRVVVAR